MTQPASSDIKSTYPPNNALRVGTVTTNDDGSVAVSVQGEIVQCGFLGPGGFVNGAPVAVLRGEASWLALGTVRETPPSTTVVSATAGLVLTTTSQNIPGAAITVTVGAPTSYFVLGCFDLSITVAAATNANGGLTVDGVAQVPVAAGSSATAVMRMMNSQQWSGTIAAGTHTFQLTGLKTVNVGTLAYNLTNTTISLRLGG